MNKNIKLDKIEEKVLNFINEESLISMGDSIVLGLSGGSDSFALSEILYTLSPILNLKLHLVYVDHHIRRNTDMDKKLIKEYAISKSLPFTFLDIYPFDFSEKTLREERYKTLLRFAEENNFDKIALGHTLDDQIETIIMNFLRGYGLEGLCGIPAKKDKFIRPILILKKEEVIEYCHKKNIKYIEDFTNLLPITLRNKIRYQLIPFLNKNIQQFPESIISQSRILAIENQFLKEKTQEYFEKIKKSNNITEIDENLWKSIPDAIKLRLLKEIFNRMEIIPSNEFLFYVFNELKLKDKRGQVAEIGDLEIYYYNKKIYLYKKEKLYYEYILPIPGKIKLPTGEIIEAELLDNENISLDFHDLWQAYFDYDKIETEILIVRNWKEGDRIKPFGLKGRTKKLQDVFIDKKVPKWKRKLLPIVLRKDEILWIPGIIRSDLAIITESTKKILHLKVKKEV